MVHGLRPFARGQVVLSRPEAREVLRFLFPLDRLPDEKELTEADLAFAQGLLVEAVDEERRLRVEEPPEELPAAERVAAGWGHAARALAAALKRFDPAWQSRPVIEGLEAELSEQARAGVSTRFRALWLARLLGAPLI